VFDVEFAPSNPQADSPNTANIKRKAQQLASRSPTIDDVNAVVRTLAKLVLTPVLRTDTAIYPWQGAVAGLFACDADLTG
jgi:hypothetical protein